MRNQFSAKHIFGLGHLRAQCPYFESQKITPLTSLEPPQKYPDITKFELFPKKAYGLR